MKSKIFVFLALFTFTASLFLGSCSKETNEALDCLRNPDECYVDEENSLKLQSAMEVDSTTAASKIPVKGEALE